MTMDHPYRHLPLPGNAPFELKPAPGKGWGAFATKRIEQGALILREEPIFTVRPRHGQMANQDVMRAFHQLSKTQKSLFSLLRDNGSTFFMTIEGAFAENSFNLGGEDATGFQLDGPRGLFLLHSRLNHSCSPNAKIPSQAGESTCLQSFATRDILPGEEITFSYEGDFGCRTMLERHQQLRFTCRCGLCQAPDAVRELSDMRRRLARGLQYLKIGRDLDGRRQEDHTGRPIITDRELRRAAEAQAIPLSSRLIYGLLVMVLSEQEGLLDKFLADRLSPGIFAVAGMFRDPINARLAKVAMAQESWFKRLDVAFRLYGRADSADAILSEMLRRGV